MQLRSEQAGDDCTSTWYVESIVSTLCFSMDILFSKKELLNDKSIEYKYWPHVYAYCFINPTVFPL